MGKKMLTLQIYVSISESYIYILLSLFAYDWFTYEMMSYFYSFVRKLTSFKGVSNSKVKRVKQ